MKPEEYVKFAEEQNEIISTAQKAICDAREEASEPHNIPPMNKLRRATTDDIKIGSVIYGGTDPKFHEHLYWSIVEKMGY